uniref:Ig-like domain-containing protein n=1 Tax=Xiphophorus couchianus TaxID=32473 RepID=A0A3B5LM40_9TELE
MFDFRDTDPSLLTSDQTILQVSSSLQQDSRFFSVKTGESVTLQCFRDPDTPARAYWYKLTLRQKPQLISTVFKYDPNGTFHREFKDDPRFTLDTKGNLNNLKITNLQPSDSATYFCITGNSYKIEFDGGTVIHVEGSGLNIQALTEPIFNFFYISKFLFLLTCFRVLMTNCLLSRRHALRVLRVF